jgi:hypothetical protein
VPDKPTLALVNRLSVVLAALLGLASIAGLWLGPRGLYAPDPATLPTFLGQDGITLVCGIPLLVVGMRLARAGSIRGLFLWSGALFYVAYSYLFYVAGARFNALFLVYVAIVASSTYGLLALLFGLDREAVKARFDPSTPVRAIAGFFLSLSVVFAAMWIGIAVSAAAAGRDLDPVTRAVIAVDGVVLLPLLCFAGLSLWRRHAWGYILAGMLLVKIAALGLTLVVNTWLQRWWGIVADPLQTAMFAVLLVGSVALLVPYLRAAGGSLAQAPLARA